MKRLQLAAVLLELADQLKFTGSWCGETHLQKATYFLQELLQVPTGMEFILYKYGPYSFDLTENLTALRADELLEMKIKGFGYGPSFETTEISRGFREHYPITLGKYKAQISFVSAKLGDKGVRDLERLATALYVSLDPKHNPPADARAYKIHRLKHHVSVDDAMDAVNEFDELSVEAAELLAPSE